MLLCDIQKCTGCMACVNICPKNAAYVSIDAEGFLRPKINEELCINCGKCNNVCPIINPIKKEIVKQNVYACWSNDKKVRRESTSGGIFTEMSKIVLNNKGVVFGVAIDENLVVRHICIDDIKDLHRLRGSKYVQSQIDDSYKKVKEYLDKKIQVLFSGTPCQIAGLYAYLGKDYENLYTCDLVCHGVPSPKVYKSYIDHIKNKYNADIVDIKFRDKKISWTYFNMKILFKNGRTYTEGYFKDPYILGFLRDNFLRPSCYNCQYTNTTRIGDITIADFWGYKSTDKKNKNNDKGISLAILNTNKGKIFFNSFKKALSFYERSLEEAVNGNPCLSRSFSVPKTRDEFWKDYNAMNFDKIIEKYMLPQKISFSQFIRCNFRYEIARWILAPLVIKNRLKRILNKIRN